MMIKKKDERFFLSNILYFNSFPITDVLQRVPYFLRDFSCLWNFRNNPTLFSTIQFLLAHGTRFAIHIPLFDACLTEEMQTWKNQIRFPIQANATFLRNGPIKLTDTIHTCATCVLEQILMKRVT